MEQKTFGYRGVGGNKGVETSTIVNSIPIENLLSKDESILNYPTG